MADIVLPVPVESSSPFDTMIPALALTEALIAAATARCADKLHDRLEEIERNRSGYQTVLADAVQAPAGLKAARASTKSGFTNDEP